EDSNAPIPLEDELQLPEPVGAKGPAPAKAAPPPPEPEPQPQAAAASQGDVAAEKAAEDELMALLNDEPVQVEPEAKEEIQPLPVNEQEETAAIAEVQDKLEEPVAPEQHEEIEPIVSTEAAVPLEV